MKNLIEIKTNNNGEQLVSGRELHEFLEIGKDFTTWINVLKDYSFISF